MLKQVTVWTEAPRGGYKASSGLVNTDKIIWGQVTRMSSIDAPLVMLVLEGTDKALICEGMPEDFMERVWIGGWDPAEYNGDAPFGNSARVIYGAPQP